MAEFFALIRYFFSIEFRNRSHIVALLMFAWIICYILYRVHPSLETTEFGYLYWLFLTLMSINVCLRSESHHAQEHRLYLYTLTDPVRLFLSKLVFNFCYLVFIYALFYFCFHIYFTEQVPFVLDFSLAIVMGAIAISASLTFVSTISTYASGQNTLVSVLAIPLLLPIIMLLKGLSDEIILGESIEYAKFMTLAGLSAVSIAASMFLIPVIWKE